MKRKFFLSVVIFFIMVSCSYSQILYFAHNNEIISFDMDSKKKSVEWKAPFNIQNPALDENCQVLTFTKSLKDDRHVGCYLLNEKKYKMIESNSNNNFGAVASPDGQKIFFNTWINNKWTISLYDIKDNSIAYDIYPPQKDESMPFGWLGDSVISIIHFSEVIFNNIYDHKSITCPLDKNIYEGISIPGSKCFFYSAYNNDSLTFFSAEDYDSSIDELEMPPLNIFKVKDGKKEKVLTGKIAVDDFYLWGNVLVIGYVDYSAPKKKYKVAIYNIDGKNIKTIPIDFAGTGYNLLGYLWND